MGISSVTRYSQLFIVSSYSVGSVLDTALFLDTPRESWETSNTFQVIYNDGEVHC